MWKKCKIIMLPTEGKSNLILSMTDDKLKIDGKDSYFAGFKKHLYVLSDDPIEENDWIYENNLNNEEHIYQVHKKEGELGFFRFRNVWIPFSKQNSATKIIATSDSSLTFDDAFNSWILPQLSQSFISLYIELYNQGNAPVDVEVEYEGTSGKLLSYGRGFTSSTCKLKIDSNNCISIKRSKEQWNRQEVINLLKTMPNFFNYSIPEGVKLRDKWIQENL